MRAFWVRLRSIRAKLTAWYLAALVAALAIYAVGVYSFVRHSLLSDLDRRLHDDAESVGEVLTEASPGEIVWRPLVQGEREDPHGEEESASAMAAIQVFSPDGRLLTQRLTRPTAAVAESLLAPPEPGAGFMTARLADGSYVRTLTHTEQIGSTAAVIRVIRSERALRAELQGLLAILLVGLPLTVAAAGLGGYLLARRALKPVGDIADRAEAITAERLSDRVPVENPDDELGHLAVVLNRTFARLEGSFEQMRRFTADASHELRTPLTAIRSVGEVGLEEPREASGYRDVIGNMLEETDRLARLVDNLLLLSRADAGQVAFHAEPADLAALAKATATHLGVLAEEKQQTVRFVSSGAVDVSVDRAVIRQAIINLLDNAIKYGPERSEITVEVRDVGESALLDVTDQGPGIPAEHAARIFDRFYRVDAARTREAGGAGLGLSIARWAVESQGGTLRLDCATAGQTRFRLTLPRQTTSAATERRNP